LILATPATSSLGFKESLHQSRRKLLDSMHLCSARKLSKRFTVAARRDNAEAEGSPRYARETQPNGIPLAFAESSRTAEQRCDMMDCKRTVLAVAASLLALAGGARADVVDFNTFVQSSDLSATEGNTATIAFNFAGNKFVGSVYFGANNNQLYSTNLSGTGLAQYGQPIPGASGEVVLGSSLGQGGFGTGNIYAGSQNNGQIYLVPASGAPSLFATVPLGGVRQIFFDPGSSFGGNMIVTTSSGNIYTVTSAGKVTLLTSVGEDTEGLDIATSAWGKYAGDLLVGSEGSGTLRLINPSGTIDKTITGFAGAETVSFVPVSLDVSNPLEGFYVANYPSNIQFAAASNFAGLQGDAVVTDEFGGSTLWDLHYDSGTDTFSQTAFTFSGNQISQFEDGIFVTPQRIADTNVPEPGTLPLAAVALLGIATAAGRRFRAEARAPRGATQHSRRA
jgi:hypothetical protein